MRPRPPTQRQIVLALLYLQALCSLVGLVYYAQARGIGFETWFILVVTVLLLGSLLLYLRGYDWARYLSVVGVAVAIAFFLPLPDGSQELPFSILLAPAYALVMAGPGWIISSAAMVYLGLAMRSGAIGIYHEPIELLIVIVVVGCMALTRRVNDEASAAAAEQARLLEEEHALLAERVAERTHDLQVANEELVRASQLKDAFLANVSHELRTPLNVILGNIGLLQEGVYGPLAERQRRSLDTIAESGQQLLGLINDLLDLAKIEAGRLAFAYTEVPVREICDSCLSLARQQAARKGLHVAFVFDPAVGSIRSDPRRLRQILINLLSNAVKFTPSGRAIGLEVRAAGSRVEFVVWDEGVGIAPEDVERLFQPFTQLDQGLARQYEGTGLGLALVRQLVALHGGQVDVVSAPGAGSRFCVRLPVTPPARS